MQLGKTILTFLSVEDVKCFRLVCKWFKRTVDDDNKAVLCHFGSRSKLVLDDYLLKKIYNDNQLYLAQFISDSSYLTSVDTFYFKVEEFDDQEDMTMVLLEPKEWR